MKNMKYMLKDDLVSYLNEKTWRDDKHREFELHVYNLMFDIVTNIEYRTRFLNSVMDAEYRSYYEKMFNDSYDGCLSENSFFIIDQLICNNILDDAEFYLIYDVKFHKWMFNPGYDFTDDSKDVQKCCDYCGVNIENCYYDYLDCWDGLNVFANFLEAIVSNDYTWLTECEYPEMKLLKDKVEQDSL